MHQLEIFTNLSHAKPKHLRNYQDSAIKSVLEVIREGKNSTVLVMPTGAGKSLTIAMLLFELGANPKNTLALVPRRKLKRQLRHEFKECGLSPQMVQTAQFLTDDKLFKQCRYQGLEYIVLDECHELAWWQPVEKLRSLNPNAFVIGLTATPDRSSRKEFIEDKFESIIYPVSFGELVNDSYLCNPTYYSYGKQLDLTEVATDIEGIFVQEQLDRQCEKKHFNESVVRNLASHNIGIRRSIIFCSSIKQSKSLTKMLGDVGISAIHVDGSMSDVEQDNAIAQVASGEISALCCAKLLIAGFDEPRIDTVVLATATNSRQSLVQMCGRGSRLHPEKNNEFWVFDFGDNFARLRLGLKQKFPYKTREDFEQKEAAMKACSNCGHLVYGFVMVCPECGEEFLKKEKPILDLQDMDIVEVEADLQDIYHAKQIRRMLRECYAKFELPFPDIAQYLQRHKIKNLEHVVPTTAMQGAIFKHRSLHNLLDLTWYCDYHTHRILSGKLYSNEVSYFKKTKQIEKELSMWKSMLQHLPGAEFGNKFLNSRAINKYIGSGRWQDILGVLDFDTRDNMQITYKRKWQELNEEIAQYLEYTDGEIDPDALAEKLQNSNSPELKDLHNRIAVLEWAYKYVNLYAQQ